MKKNGNMVIPGALAALCGAAAYVIAPRHDPRRWTELEKYRYAHRGLFREPLSASQYPPEGAGADFEPLWAEEVRTAAWPVIPENSLPAFRRAAAHHFGAELDVHFTRDLQLVIVHDSDLLRITGRPGIVEELTAEELDGYRLLGTEEKIPHFEEVLPIFADSGMPLIVEIKPTRTNYDALTEAAVACLDRYPVLYCMESFDPHVVLWLKEHRPEIVRGQLSTNFILEPDGLDPLNRFLLTNLMYNVRTRPDFIAYDFKYRKNPCVLLCCHVLGAKEANWTIGSREEMDQAEKEGHLVIFERFIPSNETFTILQ